MPDMWTAADNQTGISMRFVKQFTIHTDTIPSTAANMAAVSPLVRASVVGWLLLAMLGSTREIPRRSFLGLNVRGN